LLWLYKRLERPPKATAKSSDIAGARVVFAKARELKGVVLKREGSFYKSGKSRNSLKTKNPDFVRT
jgi:ATP-dependent DNA ligase